MRSLRCADANTRHAEVYWTAWGFSGFGLTDYYPDGAPSNHIRLVLVGGSGVRF